MFEPTFCNGLKSEALCLGLWKIIIWVGVLFVLWQIFKPRKDPRRIKLEEGINNETKKNS